MASPAKETAPIQVNVSYFRQNLQRLLKDVEQGKTVVISRYNKPVAVISPAPSKAERKGARRFGTGKGRIRIIDPHWADPMTDEEEPPHSSRRRSKPKRSFPDRNCN